MTLIVLVILLLAAVLRFHDLTLQSFWFDELMTWQRSSVPSLADVIAGAADDVWPPGYSMLMFFVIRLVGDSEFILRFPAALGGILSVASIYTLGKRLAARIGGGAWVGIFAALVMSLLQVAIYYSQEARPYSGLILHTILSTYFWLRINQSLAAGQPVRWPVAAGYMLTALIALYWNYFGLLVIGLQALGAVIWQARRMHRWSQVMPRLALIYGIIGLGYLPWLGETLHDFRYGVYFPARPGGYVEELLAYFRFLLNLEHRYAVTAIVLVLAALAVDLYRATRGSNRSYLGVWALLLLWLLLPFTIVYARSAAASYSLFLHRYLLISLPAACLLIGLALIRLPLPRVVWPLLAVLLAAELGHNLLYVKHYYAYISKAEFRKAAEYVAAQDAHLDAPSMIVGFTGYRGTESHFNYYFEQLGSPRRVEVAGGFAEDISQFEAAAESAERPYVWLIAAPERPAAEFLDYLSARYTLIDHQAYLNAEVWLFADSE